MFNFFLKLFCDAFDRIELRLDRNPGTQWMRRLRESAEATLTPIDLPYQRRWLYELTLYQPSLEALLELALLLGDSIAAEIMYVEIARDYPVERKRDARRLLLYFLRTTTLRSGPNKVRGVKNGFYFGRPGRPVRLVVYADRKSKLATAARGQWCLHSEVRLQGVEAVRHKGIGTVSELIDFDFSAFWAKHIKHWAFGSRAKLGARLGASRTNTQVQPKALQGRFRRALASKKHLTLRSKSDPGSPGLPRRTFALQVLWRRHPRITRAMTQLTAEEWLEQAARAVGQHPRTWR